MKKKGFTLIELLAVIVILAIIALIAVPTVLKIINNSRKASFTRSVENLNRLGKMEYTIGSLLYGTSDMIEFTCSMSDNVCISENGQKLEYEGILGNGHITLDKLGKTSLNISNGTYCAYKYANNEKIYVVE